MKGIIYKIECNVTGEVYYGSTQQSLNARIIQHKSKCKSWKEGTYCFITSFSIIERGNYSYSLIETVVCEDRKQLEAKERWYIENNECINKYIPTRTHKEYYEDNKQIMNDKNKQYREVAKDEIKEQKKEYYKTNKQIIKDKNKQYIEANKEQTKHYQKEYRQANKERCIKRISQAKVFKTKTT